MPIAQDWKFEEFIKSRYTQYGIFMYQNEKDIITSMHEELYFPKSEMKNISLFDKTGSEMGCKLFVNYLIRGTVVYDIKKRDYDAFRPWIEDYNEILSCFKPDNRKFVMYLRSDGYIIPYDIATHEEIEKLMEIGSISIVEISSKKWYMYGAGETENFEDIFFYKQYGRNRQ